MRRLVLAAGAGACMALAWRPSPPRVMWNTTASVPVGLYRLDPARTLRTGDLAVVRPPAEIAALLADRGWLPSGVALVKPIAAQQGQTVCRHGEVVTVDGAAAARAASFDRTGRPLPRWNGCLVLRPSEIFLLSTEPGSFDGRYLGATPATSVEAVAQPIWTRPPAPRPSLHDRRAGP